MNVCAPAEGPQQDNEFDSLLKEAVAFHGHVCPGQVLGVRLVIAGCREIEMKNPKTAGKGLVVFVEIDRCAADAVQALTGVSLGKRTMKFVDFGKMAATFVNVPQDRAVRVCVRDDARERAAVWAAPGLDPRETQMAAYRIMPEAELLAITPVRVKPEWLDRTHVRVPCEACGEGINFRREVEQEGRTLCRSCAGDGYFTLNAPPILVRDRGGHHEPANLNDRA